MKFFELFEKLGQAAPEEPKADYNSMRFKDAFGSARKDGKKTFEWKGKQYTTELAKPKVEKRFSHMSDGKGNSWDKDGTPMYKNKTTGKMTRHEDTSYDKVNVTMKDKGTSYSKQVYQKDVGKQTLDKAKSGSGYTPKQESPNNPYLAGASKGVNK